MQTFRIPRELVTFLKEDAAKNGLDLTAYVNKMLEGVRTWYCQWWRASSSRRTASS